MGKKLPSILKEIKNKTICKVDYNTQKSISYSQFSIYNQCPQRWALQYIENNKIFSSTIHTVFGTAIHTTIQHYLTVMYDQSGAAADNEDLISLFEQHFIAEYKNQCLKNNNQHFSNPEEMREFFEDGANILNFFKKKKSEYFSKRGWYLVGCEIPISLPAYNKFPDIIYNGFLDVVLYHEPTNEFLIIDLKTSTRGWGDKEKKDEIKQFQLILYKKFFSEQFNVPLDNIKIEFIIVKRKIYENSEYNISRIQEFIPSSGKIKIKRASDALNNFIENAFDGGGFKKINHLPKVSDNCKWCPFYKCVLCSATYEN
jgi:hypothetical protein